MTEFDQALPVLPLPTHEEEVMSLRKQMRSQEAEWKKNKAVLEQRIEILELQNRELKEREENLKKMNNSIFSALKDFNKENDPTYSKIIRELEASKQQVTKEYSDYRIRYQEMVKNLENENRDLKDKLIDLETKHNQTTLHYEKNEAAQQQKILNLENEKKNVAMVLKLYEDERKQFKDKELNQNELQSKITELRYLLEKQTGEQRREVDKVHHDYTQSISSMKMLAESEKNALENQIRRLLDSKKLDGSLFEDIKRNYESEIMILRKERDNSMKKNEGQDQQINQLNETVRAFEEKMAQQKIENDRDQKELKKLKLRVMDVDSQMRKYEQGEKSLKQMLTEKEYKIEEVSAEHKKKINNEKRKYEQAQELAKKYKEEGEKKVSIVMQESIKKDEMIKKLKGQLRNKEDKMNRKSENETNKTNTSLVNISLVSQSISNSKYNPSRSFIQEVKTTRDPSGSRSVIHTKKEHSKLSRDYTAKTLGKESQSQRDNLDTNEDEEDPKDITNENILLGLNSPRAFNSVSTYRNHPSSKKDTEQSLTSSNRNNSDKQGFNFRRGDKSVLNMNLCDMCNHDLEINERNTEDEVNSYTHREHTLAAGPQNLSNTSFEIKKKSTSLCEPAMDLAKAAATEYDSRTFLHINEFHDGANSVSSVSNMMKNGLSLNPSVSNLSKGLQEALGNSDKSPAYQPNGYEYTEGITRTKRSNTEEYKVKLLEDRLKEAESKANKAGLDREKLQVELDRLILELKQTKMEWALSEESKEECELALKNEIKFLINKLLQVKNTGVSSSSSQGDLSQFTKSTLNKSTMDPQSSSFINTSGFLNFSHSNPANHFASFTSNIPEQNNMTIIHNNLGERKLVDSTEKKMLRKPQKTYSEETKVPLRDKCLNTGELEGPNDSPRKVSEFNNNENNLLMNLLTTSTNPKKLMRHVKR